MSRKSIKRLTDIPNVGQDPYQFYEALCSVMQKKHDSCVFEVFISAVRYVEGGPLKKWWAFTEERKRRLGDG